MDTEGNCSICTKLNPRADGYECYKCNFIVCWECLVVTLDHIEHPCGTFQSNTSITQGKYSFYMELMESKSMYCNTPLSGPNLNAATETHSD